MSSDIKIKVGVDGEKQFKQAIKEMNSEMKLLKSEMNLVASTYDGQANSMEALAAKQKNYEKQIEATKNKIKTLGEALENAKNTFGDNSTKVNEWQTKLNNAQTELNNLNTAASKNAQYMEEAAEAADGCAKSIDEYGNAAKSASDGSGEAANAVDTLAEALAAAGLAKTLEEITEALKACVSASMEFESAMAGVAKTTDLSGAELETMSNAIQDMSTNMPATTTEIAGVVEAAGQLGIAKEDLLAFSEVMVNLGVATNLTSDEAASALAKFANVVNMNSANYENLGSTIVALGNNFATTESDIVSMATRLASAGTTIGLTEAQIMAVATALSSVGIEAEAGGSAISKLLKQFETMVATGDDSLSNFSEIAGMTAEEFTKAWGEDAIGALSQFIDGLGGIEDSGGSMVATLSELGITETRLSNAVQALASSEGILNKAVTLANTAWDENTALAKEAETRYATTESKTKMLANAFDNLKVAIGDQLTPALAQIADSGTEALSWVTDFVQQNEWLVPVLTGVVTTLGTVVAGVTAYITWTKVATAVTTAFSAVMSATPFVAVAAALGVLVAAYAACASSQETFTSGATEIEQSIKSQRDSIEETAEAVSELKTSYEEESAAISDSLSSNKQLATTLVQLANSSEKTAGAKAQMQAIVEQLSQSVPELADAYNQETGELNMTAEAIYALLEAEAQQQQFEEDKQAWLEANERQNELIEQQTQAQEVLNQAYAKYQEMMNSSDPLSAYGVEGAYDDYESAKENVLALNAAMLENESVLNAASEAMEGYATTTEETAEANLNFIEIGKLTGEQLAELQEAYTSAYNAAAESLNSTVGLWEAMDNTAVTSASDVQSALESQTEWFTNYRDNLDALASREIPGVDTSALVSSLSDGSTESAEILAGLSTATDTEIANIVAAMQDSDQAREALTGTMAECSSEFQGKMDEIVQSCTDMVSELDQSSQAETSGMNTINGYIAGIDAQTSTLYTKMQTVARTAWNKFRAQLEEHSPSRVAMRSGENTIKGYILGVEEEEDHLNEVMEEAADKVLEAFPDDSDGHDKAKEFTDAYTKAFKQATSDIQDAIDDINKSQESMLKKLTDYGELDETTTASALQAQIDAMQKYAETMAALKSRGADSSLLSEITDMSIDDATAFASSLNSLTDEAWEEYQSKWREKQELAASISEDYYKDELETQTKALSGVLDEAMAGLADDGSGSGANFVLGIIEGMQSQEAALTEEATKLADMMTAAINGALGIHSPSKVAEEIMGHFGDGMIIGWNTSIAKLQATIDDSIPRQVVGTVEKSLDTGTLVSAMENTASGIVNGLAATQATNSKPVQLRVDLDGRELAEGIVDPLRKTLRRRNEKL